MIRTLFHHYNHSVMKKILLTIGIFLIIVVAATGSYLKFGMPDVGNPENLTIKITPERVKRGEYLANHVSACMDCHSKRDWSTYSGPVTEGSFGMGGEKFDEALGVPGTVYSPNITPSGIGHWTDGELFRAITTGVKNNGQALFPLMPYHFYGRMDKEDIYDIIAYIRTLKPIENNTPVRKLNFPANFIVNTIPVRANFQKKPEKSDTVSYGGYLVNAAGCIDCHTPAKKGELILEKSFAGGRDFNLPFGTLYSANITPDVTTGIGSWTPEEFVSRFKTFANPADLYLVTDKDVNTVMPWTFFAGMDTSDLRSIYAYMQTIEPKKNKVIHFVKR